MYNNTKNYLKMSGAENTIQDTIKVLEQLEKTGMKHTEEATTIREQFFSHLETIAKNNGITFEDIYTNQNTDNTDIKKGIENFNKEIEKYGITYKLDEENFTSFKINGLDTTFGIKQENREIYKKTYNQRIEEKVKQQDFVRKLILIIACVLLLSLLFLATYLLIKHFNNKSNENKRDKNDNNREQDKKDKEETIDTKQPDQNTGETVRPKETENVKTPTGRETTEEKVLSNEVVGDPGFTRTKDCEIAKYIETHPNANIDITANGQTYKMPLNVKIDTNGNCTFRDIKSGRDISVKADDCTIYCYDNNYGEISGNVKSIMQSQEINGGNIYYANTTTSTKVDGHTLNIDYKTDDGVVYGTAQLDNIYYQNGNYVQKQPNGNYIRLSDNLQEQLSNTNDTMKNNKTSIGLEDLLKENSVSV